MSRDDDDTTTGGKAVAKKAVKKSVKAVDNHKTKILGVAIAALSALQLSPDLAQALSATMSPEAYQKTMAVAGLGAMLFGFLNSKKK